MSNTDIVYFLRQIPQSNQDAAPIHDLMNRPLSAVDSAGLYGYARLLHTLGMVDFDPETGTIRARSQTAKYALNSLAAYVENDLRIIDDWKTRGIGDNILYNGASFLHALDLRRLTHEPNASPSRREKVAQVLIKRSNPHTGDPELFFQYDENARRYQLIGGRWSPEDGDDMMRTIIREIEEELPDTPLVYAHDYALKLLIADFSPPAALSPTFGALTEYHFHIYHMTHLAKPLTLRDCDKWVPVYQVRQGVIIGEDGMDYELDTDIYAAMDAAIPGGLTHLQSSFADD
jgi:hypothetical protein